MAPEGMLFYLPHAQSLGNDSKNVPQRLKAVYIRMIYGTAESVPVVSYLAKDPYRLANSGITLMSSDHQ